MSTISAEPLSRTEAARRLLRAEDCVLSVIDVQEKLLPAIWEKERVVRNSQLLIRLALLLDIPIVASAQYRKGLGETVPEIASLMPDVRVVDKLEFGCFGNADFCAATASLAGRNTLLMRDSGAVISSTEMMMYELMGKSGTPVFKEMLKHLK
jgi:hypothetical protein